MITDYPINGKAKPPKHWTAPFDPAAFGRRQKQRRKEAQHGQ